MLSLFCAIALIFVCYLSDRLQYMQSFLVHVLLVSAHSLGICSD